MAVTIDLSGRVILICGVARGGIGGFSACRAAEAGAHVVLVDHMQGALDQTAEDIARIGAASTAIQADLLDPAQSRAVIRRVHEACGRLDGLVNVAGGTKRAQFGPAEMMSDAVTAEIMELNFGYVARICRDAAALMIEQGRAGSIVNIASLNAHLSAPRHGIYGAAKAALIALTRTMAGEWVDRGIRANTISPGAVASARIVNKIPGGKLPEALLFTSPEAVANVALFLLSDLSSEVTGRDIVVDGGMMAELTANPRNRPSV